MAIKLDGVSNVESLDLPGVPEHEPVVGLLMLESVLDVLPEHPVLVPDTISPCWKIEGGHGIQEACGQPAQPPVS